MSWSRRGSNLLLQVRCAVLNGKLGSGFDQISKADADCTSELAVAAQSPILLTLSDVTRSPNIKGSSLKSSFCITRSTECSIWRARPVSAFREERDEGAYSNFARLPCTTPAQRQSSPDLVAIQRDAWSNPCRVRSNSPAYGYR
jgi:hypothetical protein